MVDAVDAIPGIDVYVGKQAGEEWWIRNTFWRIRDDEATGADRDRYTALSAEMEAADGLDAVKAELEHRGRVILFRKPS